MTTDLFSYAWFYNGERSGFTASRLIDAYEFGPADASGHVLMRTLDDKTWEPVPMD